jgi:hypothetical protein
MNPSEWLEENVTGFSLLSGEEREAIKDFSLLWSLYEGTILNTSGSANAIIRAVESLKASGRLTLEPLRGAINDRAERLDPATANRVLTYLKAALNLAWRNSLMPSDDAWRRAGGAQFKEVQWTRRAAYAPGPWQLTSARESVC